MEDKNSNYLWNKSEKIMTNSIVRKLPIGIQTFEKIREGNYVYVDKTEWVWRMRILRTETAGLAILSVLMFQLENE